MSRLLHLAFFVGLGLFVRAIVRESEDHGREAPMLPPPPLKTRKRATLS